MYSARSVFLVLLCAVSVCHATSTDAPLVKRIELSSATEFSLPVAGDGQTSVAERAGVALSLRDCDARLYGYTDKIQLPTDDVPSTINFPMWGVDVKLQRFVSTPLSVQAGTLTTSGSLSRLRTPELPTPSLFSATYTLPRGVTVALPTLTSSKKANAVAVSAEANAWQVNTRISAIADEDGQSAASVACTTRLPNAMKAGVCVTGGLFPIEDKKAKTASQKWYSSTPYFTDCTLYGAVVQTYFDSPFATCILTANAYQQPTKDTAFTGRAEAALQAGDFSLRAALFAVDDYYVLASDNNYIKKTLQFMAQPCVTRVLSRSRLAKLSLGAYAFVERYAYGQTYGKMDKYTVMNAATGARYFDRNFSAQVTFTANNIQIIGEGTEDDKYTKYKVATSASLTGGRVNPKWKASFDFTPESGEISTAASGEVTAAGKRVRITGKAGLEASHKASGDDTLTLDASLKADITHSPLHVTIKLAATSRVM